MRVTGASVADASCIQRHWRGVRTRRNFSDRLVAAAPARLGADPSFIHFDKGYGEEERPSPAARPRAFTPSLEEALEEAALNQYLHFTPTPDVAWPPPHEHSLATLTARPETAGAGPSNASDARCERREAQPPSDVRAEAGGGDDGTSLEFTAAVAEAMTVEALKEHVAMLTRIIGTRNRELVGLLERRDELLHAREYRQATVASLVSQVDRSRFAQRQKKRGTKAAPAESKPKGPRAR